MDFRNQQSIESLSDELRAWFSEGLGSELLEAEQRMIDRLLPGLYGCHLLQVGIDPLLDLTSQSDVPHKVILYHSLMLGMPQSSIVALSSELPVETNSVDVVLLHHALDYTSSPHQVLREAARVLRPGGHLLIINFNPASLWGVSRLMTRERFRSIWQKAHFISHHRVQDWIHLLELTELRSMSDYFLPPYESTSWRKRFSILQPFGRKSLPGAGAFNAILVRKEVGGMTRIQEKRRSRQFIRLPVAEPAARGHARETR